MPPGAYIHTTQRTRIVPCPAAAGRREHRQLADERGRWIGIARAFGEQRAARLRRCPAMAWTTMAARIPAASRQQLGQAQRDQGADGLPPDGG